MPALVHPPASSYSAAASSFSAAGAGLHLRQDVGVSRGQAARIRREEVEHAAENREVRLLGAHQHHQLLHVAVQLLLQPRHLWCMLLRGERKTVVLSRLQVVRRAGEGKLDTMARQPTGDTTGHKSCMRKTHEKKRGATNHVATTHGSNTTPVLSARYSTAAVVGIKRKVQHGTKTL